MEIIVKKDEKTLVVSVSGRIDAVSAPDFDRQVEEQITKGEINFLMDLSGLDYISSAGLRSMLTTAKKLRANNGDLILCGLRDIVNEVFDVSGFSTIFKIYDSVEEALKVDKT
jgi:anti-anti-sigma factor